MSTAELKIVPESQRKRKRSLATRQDIIEATIDCFVEIGYFRTTTTEIAKKADVTRGAVQHYFPTTKHVLEASIRYLVDEWINGYASLSRNTPPGTDYIDNAVDNMWDLVNGRLFVAWRELVATARTDPELYEIIAPAAAEYEQARKEAGRRAYPDFAAAEYDKFEHNRDTLRFLLEGMASTMITYDEGRRTQAQLDWIKDRLHDAWVTERNQVKIKD